MIYWHVERKSVCVYMTSHPERGRYQPTPVMWWASL
jgi:hypothetical protein